MGLDIGYKLNQTDSSTVTSWSGAYSSFHKFRQELFNLVQLEYRQMLENEEYIDDLFVNDKEFINIIHNVVHALDLEHFWDSDIVEKTEDHDPIFFLLNHSDCDGFIPLTQLVLLHSRLIDLKDFFDSYSSDINFMEGYLSDYQFLFILNSWIDSVDKAVHYKSSLHFY